MFTITQEDVILIEKALKGTRPSFEIQQLVGKLKFTIRMLNHQIIRQELKKARSEVENYYHIGVIDTTKTILEQMVD